MGLDLGPKAIVRERIQYGSGDGRRAAPCGEYRIEAHGDCIGLCECGGGCDFTLSFDAFQQHVVEGRIAIQG